MRILLTLLAVAGLSACASTQHFDVVQPTDFAKLESQGTAQAGAVIADITPPPGMPMGGYSVMANRGEGFRSRIKARIIYLNDGKGQALALIQGDVTAASLLVHHMVAANVAAETGLKPSEIAFTASHSHSAPVNYFDNDFYNKHTSSGQWLEVQYLNLVVEQISQGIIEAYQSRRPAKIATGQKDLYGFTRNRSLDSYVLNSNAKDIDLQDPEAKFKAVDPSMNMLRVDVKDRDGQYKPLAAFSTFSVHNTTITVPVDVYNGDLFGFASRDLEWAIADRYHTSWPVVHALAVGSHGDMAPALEDNGDNWIGHFPLDWRASKKMGHDLGRAAIDLFEELQPKLTANVTLGSAARELNIREHNQADGVEICKDAAVGAPVAAGAYERRTPWLTLIPFFHGGTFLTRRTFFADGCQGNKQHLGFAYLQPLLEPKDSFPNTVMFQILRINDAVILPLPFELTIESGRRIASAVADTFAEANQAPKYTWVTGVANGYFGYTTTPEEYSRQNYEGGHTLYGKNSTPYLAAKLSELAKDYLRQGNLQELFAQWQYDLKVNQFLPAAQDVQGQRAWLEAPTNIEAKNELDERYVRVRWQDVNASKIDFHQPLVQLETLVGDQWVPLVVQGKRISDQGYDVEVRYLDDAKQGMAEYEARWYSPSAGAQYRFVIAPRDGQAVLHSPSFKLGENDQLAIVGD